MRRIFGAANIRGKPTGVNEKTAFPENSLWLRRCSTALGCRDDGYMRQDGTSRRDLTPFAEVS
jgi:hypothetical protein